MGSLSVQPNRIHPLPTAHGDVPIHKKIDLLAVTQKGTGQIININKRGLSFGCLYAHTFPQEFHVDLLSARGTLIKKVNVRKIRETSGDLFELVVGVEFAGLSPSQAEELNSLFGSHYFELG
jgi:hypothetical protein